MLVNLSEHPFSFLNSSLGLAGGNITRECTFPYLWSFFAQVMFVKVDILYFSYHFSLRSSGWVSIAACGSIAAKEISCVFVHTL